ncbi:hypothetical protein H206_05403 [Candidatus Electrothrix aarhusensis]|uniref:Uncharacterized protein n=1 Tax=Candidatus Electrothrix aarhusensis TaxID=1859131 RepID=A0A444J4K5_9BACT|nr:hypothetical protein H206_05403 [Candidatus Electrothrix aarhusensis]
MPAPAAYPPLPAFSPNNPPHQSHLHFSCTDPESTFSAQHRHPQPPLTQYP